MRQRPKIQEHGSPLIERPVVPRPGKTSPFLISGGMNFFWPNEIFPSGDAAENGIQFICSVYIPKGYQGFLKQLRVAPFKPAILNPKFLTWDGVTTYRAFWTGFNISGDNEPIRPDGVWETPFGWESYFNGQTEFPFPPAPKWTWSLRLIAGDIKELRRSRNNFPTPNITDLNSWYLIPDIAVPNEVYGSGFPGTSPGFDLEAQRMQVVQGDQLSLNVPIPEDSTLALFAQWTQKPYSPVLEYGQDSREFYYGEDTMYVILPSFGQLLGYMQTLGESAAENLLYGWGG